MKKWFLALVLVVFALTSYAAERTGADAAATIQNQADLILGKLAGDTETYVNDTNKFSKLIHDEVLPYFDIELMTQFVLGRHARDAAPAQKQAFADALIDLLIRVYSKGWSEYAESSVKVTNKPEIDKHGRTNVHITITTPNGKNIPGEFRMRYKDGRWLVYDVSFENVSIVTSYRNSFDTKIRNQGIEKVIEEIKTMNDTGDLEVD